MPRYHFNVYNGKIFLDVEGVDLPSLNEVRLEAIRYAGEILSNTANRIALGEDWRMEVTDDKGLIIFRLDFSVMEAAAGAGDRL